MLLCIHKQSATHLLNICNPLGSCWLRPYNVLVVWCGLLGKQLRERVRVREGARECTICLSSGLISVVDNFVFVGSRKCVTVTYEYSIDDIPQSGSW